MEHENLRFVGDTTTTTKFRIADLDHPMNYPEYFDTPQEALNMLDVEYTNRNKGDGHDEYWQRRRTGIVKVTITEEVIHDNKKMIKNPL